MYQRKLIKLPIIGENYSVYNKIIDYLHRTPFQVSYCSKALVECNNYNYII